MIYLALSLLLPFNGYSTRLLYSRPLVGQQPCEFVFALCQGKKKRLLLTFVVSSAPILFSAVSDVLY